MLQLSVYAIILLAVTVCLSVCLSVFNYRDTVAVVLVCYAWSHFEWLVLKLLDAYEALKFLKIFLVMSISMRRFVFALFLVKVANLFWAFHWLAKLIEVLLDSLAITSQYTLIAFSSYSSLSCCDTIVPFWVTSSHMKLIDCHMSLLWILYLFRCVLSQGADEGYSLQCIYYY